MVSRFQRITQAMIGRYTRIMMRTSGLDCSEGMRPRMSSAISTGTRVTESSAAPAMEKVLV